MRESIANGDSSPEVVLVGFSAVLLTIISSNSTSISVTATIAYSDAVGLNGTSIQCDTEDRLTVSVPNVMTSECLWFVVQVLMSHLLGYKCHIKITTSNPKANHTYSLNHFY